MNNPLTEGSTLKAPKSHSNLVPSVAPAPQSEKEILKKQINSMTDKYNELGQEFFIITKMMDQESKTGRNNRCHCGSMKKYKNCCLHLYEEKRARIIELTGSMGEVALEIKETHKEIKELKNVTNK